MNTAAIISKVTENENHSEGPVAKAIENQTAKLPSDTFLWLALGSIGTSLGLQFAGKKEQSTFVGQWAPVFLLLGIYNKLVKVAGSDKSEQDGTLESKSKSSMGTKSSAPKSGEQKYDSQKSKSSTSNSSQKSGMEDEGKVVHGANFASSTI